MITVLYNHPEEPKAPIRTISVGSLRRRLTVAEKVSIRVSEDPVVQVLSEDLSSSAYVDLDSKEISDGFSYLVSVGILEPERVPELLRDGTEAEQP